MLEKLPSWNGSVGNPSTPLSQLLDSTFKHSNTATLDTIWIYGMWEDKHLSEPTGGTILRPQMAWSGSWIVLISLDFNYAKMNSWSCCNMKNWLVQPSWLWPISRMFQEHYHLNRLLKFWNWILQNHMKIGIGASAHAVLLQGTCWCNGLDGTRYWKPYFHVELIRMQSSTVQPFSFRSLREKLSNLNQWIT